MLTQGLRSTAEGIQPSRAMRKTKSRPDHGSRSAGAGGTAEIGVCRSAPTVAPTVPMSRTTLIALMTLSRAA